MYVHLHFSWKKIIRAGETGLKLGAKCGCASRSANVALQVGLAQTYSLFCSLALHNLSCKVT
jgi:hypothetical protein